MGVGVKGTILAKTKQKQNIGLFYSLESSDRKPNFIFNTYSLTALLRLQQMALLDFFPTTLCRGVVREMRFHDSNPGQQSCTRLGPLNDAPVPGHVHKRGLPEVREPDALVREGRVVREVPVEHVELVHLHQVLAESTEGFNNDQQFKILIRSPSSLSYNFGRNGAH